MARTPLYDAHAALGATFTDFAGYEMPVHYGSIKEEHSTVRTAVGLFDVSHMSKLRVRDDGDALSRTVPKHVGDVEVGRGRYTVLLRDDGTILDDVFMFRRGEDDWFIIPNAGMATVVADHLSKHGVADVVDEADEWGILALQGPNARTVLSAASEDPAPKFHRMVDMEVAGVACRVSGTGYTGEKGVELYVPADGLATVWDHLLSVGVEHGIKPIGLGARDTLRLEKGYALAGNEFAGGRTPLEASLDWLVDFDHDFVGRGRLIRQRAQGHDRLMGLLQEKGVPRQGYTVFVGGSKVGEITSGTLSPTLGTGIALAYLKDVDLGDEVQVDVRGRVMPATVAAPPFV